MKKTLFALLLALPLAASGQHIVADQVENGTRVVSVSRCPVYVGVASEAELSLSVAVSGRDTVFLMHFNFGRAGDPRGSDKTLTASLADGSEVSLKTFSPEDLYGKRPKRRRRKRQEVTYGMDTLVYSVADAYVLAHYVATPEQVRTMMSGRVVSLEIRTEQESIGRKVRRNRFSRVLGKAYRLICKELEVKPEETAGEK